MIFLHFVSCCLLTFGPIWTIFGTSHLAAERLGHLVRSAVRMYLGTQLGKFALIALVLPDAVSESEGLLGDAVALALQAVDVAVLVRLLRRSRARAVSKVLGTGLGWALGDALFGRLLPLWVGTRENEFSWAPLRSAAEANVDLLATLALAALAFLVFVSRTGGARAAAAPLLVALCLAPVGVRLAAASAGVDEWAALGMRAAVTALLAVLARAAFKSESD